MVFGALGVKFLSKSIFGILSSGQKNNKFPGHHSYLRNDFHMLLAVNIGLELSLISAILIYR